MLAGGNGFLGDLLSREFQARGFEIVVLSRRPLESTATIRQVAWDGREPGEWSRWLDGARAVINLSGRSVNCRYNARNRELIMRSRTDSTRAIGRAICQLAHPPAAWFNASTATIYKHSLDRPMDEISGEMDSTPSARDAFSVDVARAWEAAFAEASTPATRKVALRISMVLGTRTGSVFGVLRNLTKLGLGGSMAGGKQYVSWVHETDFRRAILWLLDHDDLSGPFNLTSPNPVPNRELMQTFRKVGHVPVGMPATRWMLEIGAFFMRTESELMLKSRRAVPRRLLECGFEFRFPQLQGALEEIEGRFKASREGR